MLSQKCELGVTEGVKKERYERGGYRATEVKYARFKENMVNILGGYLGTPHCVAPHRIPSLTPSAQCAGGYIQRRSGSAHNHRLRLGQRHRHTPQDGTQELTRSSTPTHRGRPIPPWPVAASRSPQPGDVWQGAGQSGGRQLILTHDHRATVEICCHSRTQQGSEEILNVLFSCRTLGVIS